MAKTERAGAGFQQAAGLIRYFDAEEETAIHIHPGAVLGGCFLVTLVVILVNYLFPL